MGFWSALAKSIPRFGRAKKSDDGYHANPNHTAPYASGDCPLSMLRYIVLGGARSRCHDLIRVLILQFWIGYTTKEAMMANKKRKSAKLKK